MQKKLIESISEGDSMEFINSLMDYIDANIDMGMNGSEPVKVKMPMLNEKNSVAIRLTPSTPTDYIAGFTYEVGFQVLTKNNDQIKAITVLTNIFNALHGKPKVIVGEKFSCITLQCETLPNYVETTDDGFYIYTAIFNAEIDILGG